MLFDNPSARAPLALAIAAAAAVASLAPAARVGAAVIELNKVAAEGDLV